MELKEFTFQYVSINTTVLLMHPFVTLCQNLHSNMLIIKEYLRAPGAVT